MAAGAGVTKAERDGRSAVPQDGRRATRPLRITHRSLSWSPSPHYDRSLPHLAATGSIMTPRREAGTPAFSVIPSRLVLVSSPSTLHRPQAQGVRHTRPGRLRGFAIARHSAQAKKGRRVTRVRAPPGRQIRCDVTTGFVLAPLTRCTVTCSRPLCWNAI